MHADWLIPDWSAPANVRAVFTTRSGGASSVPWDSMNLGDHVFDDPDRVGANRALLQQTTGTRVVFLKQVHGTDVLSLDASMPDGLQADACLTTQRGLGCTIMVADCLPVLLASEDGAVVAAAHAGWRSLAGTDGQGILESVVNGMNATRLKNSKNLEIPVNASFSHLTHLNVGCSAIKIVAWLGPCIGPSAFEVGADVKRAFEHNHHNAGQCFAAIGKDKYLADLAGLARLRLQALGVSQISGNDGTEPWCTVSNPSTFFSHRRDAGPHGNGFQTTGRMAACIWRA